MAARHIAAAGILLVATGLGAAIQENRSDYEARILKEREQRVIRLRAGDFSPLKKIRVHRLSDSGRISVGSGPEADIRIESQGIAPVHFVLEGKSVTPTLRAIGGRVVSTWDKKERAEWVLRHEYGFHLGNLNVKYWVNPQTGVRTLQVFDPEAPAMKRFPGLEFFPVDAAYRVEAEVVPSAKAQPIQLIDSAGNQQSFWIYGELRFRLQGKSCALELYTPGLDPAVIAKEGFTLMFTDETSGKESYPATRYLSIEGKLNGPVTVDFNRALTPPCNFSPLYSCPFPRKQNRLAVAIRAGEMWYRDPAEARPQASK
jgi:hypothetical protein